MADRIRPARATSMRITTTARHCELDPEDRLHAEEHLRKLLRFARDIQEAHLILTADRQRFGAEVTIHVAGRDLVARVEANTPRAAISEAIERIEHQLRKLKERRLERRRGDRTRAADALAEPSELDEPGGTARET